MDVAVAAVAVLDDDAESVAFRAYVERQPHLVDFVVSLTEDMGEHVEERSVDVLFRIDAIFASANGGPVPTIDAAAIQRVNERTIAEFEAAVRGGSGTPAVRQPHVLAFAEEALSAPLEDEDGDPVDIPEDDRAVLLLGFRTVLEALDQRRGS